MWYNPAPYWVLFWRLPLLLSQGNWVFNTGVTYKYVPTTLCSKMVGQLLSSAHYTGLDPSSNSWRGWSLGRWAVVRREWVSTIVFRYQAAVGGLACLSYFIFTLCFLWRYSFLFFCLFHGMSVKSDIIKLSLLSGLNHSLSPRSI